MSGENEKLLVLSVEECWRCLSRSSSDYVCEKILFFHSGCWLWQRLTNECLHARLVIQGKMNREAGDTESTIFPLRVGHKPLFVSYASKLLYASLWVSTWQRTDLHSNSLWKTKNVSGFFQRRNPDFCLKNRPSDQPIELQGEREGWHFSHAGHALDDFKPDSAPPPVKEA